MRVLVIKISSMGDLIHTLPALTDASNAIKQIEFDWLCDPSFSDIPTWHPAVKNVIAAPVRKWKQNKILTLTSGELSHFKQRLQQVHYDLIIDAQSALKTAVMSTLAKGKRAGMDRRSVREFGAHWFYHTRYFIDKDQHAIARLRQLFAKALNYPTPHTNPTFGINLKQLHLPQIELPKHYIVCTHATTWKSKHWTQENWHALIEIINKQGLSVILPWGTLKEKHQAQALAKKRDAYVLPKLSLTEYAAIIQNAKGTISVDTGLGHLACALTTPSIHLYGPTDPKKIGAFGLNQILLSTDFNCAPCYKKTCAHHASKQGEATCLHALKPQQVWGLLKSQL